MKLTELHGIDILDEFEHEGQTIAFVIRMDEGISTASFASRAGGLVTTALNMTKNPLVAAGLTMMAVGAYEKYKKNKRITTQFFAVDSTERTMYKRIVDELMRTGHYRKEREEYADGGYLWVLKRIS